MACRVTKARGGCIMTNEIEGVRVAFVPNESIEEVELTEPWTAVLDAGGSSQNGRAQAW
jgi:hypothetical protein